MFELNNIEFPSKYLTCYESVLMTLLKHQGVTEETALMGTQAFFVFSPADFSVSPKFSRVDAEWKRLYGCQIASESVMDRDDLQRKLLSRLDEGTPVCLPVDLYALPHTLHYQQLHQHHYINVFGHENGRYYMVCPYYRYQDWVNADLIHDGFFSPVVREREMRLITIPKFTMPPIDEQRISTIVEENCHYMLNLAIPNTLLDPSPQYLGIAGLKTFAQHFQQLADQPGNASTRKAIYINLSRYVTAMGNSRYWLCEFMRTYQPTLLSSDLQNQFTKTAQTWKAIGMQLGMVAHGQRPKIIQHVTLSLQELHQQEIRLFNTLLGSLPTYEQGTL